LESLATNSTPEVAQLETCIHRTPQRFRDVDLQNKMTTMIIATQLLIVDITHENVNMYTAQGTESHANSSYLLNSLQ